MRRIDFITYLNTQEVSSECLYVTESQNHQSSKRPSDYLVQPSIITPETYPRCHIQTSRTLPDSTTSLGNLIHCLTTLSGEDIFLIPNLNMMWCNLMLFPSSFHLGRGSGDRSPPIFGGFGEWGGSRWAEGFSAWASRAPSVTAPRTLLRVLPELRGPELGTAARCGLGSTGDSPCPAPALLLPCSR